MHSAQGTCAELAVALPPGKAPGEGSGDARCGVRIPRPLCERIPRNALYACRRCRADCPVRLRAAGLGQFWADSPWQPHTAGFGRLLQGEDFQHLAAGRAVRTGHSQGLLAQHQGELVPRTRRSRFRQPRRLDRTSGTCDRQMEAGTDKARPFHRHLPRRTALQIRRILDGRHRLPSGRAAGMDRRSGFLRVYVGRTAARLVCLYPELFHTRPQGKLPACPLA